MTTCLRGLDAADRPLTRLLNLFLGLLVALMTLDVAYQVLRRIPFKIADDLERWFGLSRDWAIRIFRGQPDWTEEAALILLVWIGMVGSAAAARRRAHLGIDVLALAFGHTGRRLVGALVALVVAGFAAIVMGYGGLNLVDQVRNTGQRTAALQWPQWVVYLSLPLGGLLIVFYAARDLLICLVGEQPDLPSIPKPRKAPLIVSLLVLVTLATLFFTGVLAIPGVLLVVGFAVLVAYSVPISFALGTATLLAWIADELQYGASLREGLAHALISTAPKIMNGIDSFPLLAIPFFIFSGLVMGQGGIARRLVDLAQILFGWLHAGLAMVNVAACMFFGAISGSATAATSSIGTFLIPIMEEEGYDRDYSAAVTMAGATTGLVIPPSNVMIVYAVVASGVSIAALFLAGFLPGIMMGAMLMLAARWMHRRSGRSLIIRMVAFNVWILACFLVPYVAWISGILVLLAFLAALGVSGWRLYRKVSEEGWNDVLAFLRKASRVFLRAFFSLLLIVFVLGGILTGWFTATEASVTAVIYALILAVVVYKEVRWRDLPEILLQTGITTAFIMLLIGTSSAMGQVLTSLEIPERVSEGLLGVSDNGIVLMLIINAILLVVGTFMDMTPAVLIFTPIFLPVVTGPQVGMHPLHFGLVLIVNLCIGLLTPPVGSVLFVGCGVAKTSIAAVIKPLLPMYAMLITCLLVLTYMDPEIILWLPRAFRVLAS